jgi:hypothetical protein
MPWVRGWSKYPSNYWRGEAHVTYSWIFTPIPPFPLSHINLPPPSVPLYSNQRNYKAYSPTLCHRWYNELNQRFRTHSHGYGLVRKWIKEQSGSWCHLVTWQDNDVSEDSAASIFSVKLLSSHVTSCRHNTTSNLSSYLYLWVIFINRFKLLPTMPRLKAYLLSCPMGTRVSFLEDKAVVAWSCSLISVQCRS